MAYAEPMLELYALHVELENYRVGVELPRQCVAGTVITNEGG